MQSQVNFPLVLDCYEFCTDEYKKVLDKPREAIKAIEDKKAGIAKAERDKARKERDEKEEAAKATKKRPLQVWHLFLHPPMYACRKPPVCVVLCKCLLVHS